MDKRYWVGFNLVKGIGAVRLQALQDHFGDLSLAWQAPVEALQAAGLSQNWPNVLYKSVPAWTWKSTCPG